MLKKLFAGLITTVAAAALSIASYAAVYEPYTLCYNSTYAGSHEGIQAGWVLDNRGGALRTSIFGGYESLTDISAVRGNALYRDLNLTDEGVVTAETKINFRSGFDGLSVRFADESGNITYSLETDNGAFYILEQDGSRRKLLDGSESQTYHLIITLDFENGTANTVISGTNYGNTQLLSDNIQHFGFYTSAEDVLSIVPSGTKITANYYLHDDFTYYTSSAKQLPYGWETTDINNAYIASSQAFSDNGGVLSKEFDRVSGKLSFEGVFYTSAPSLGYFTLYDGEKAAFSLGVENGDILFENTVVYPDALSDFWYRFRIEADFDTHTALIKINGREVATVDFPADVSGADKVAAEGYFGGIKFDDIRLFSLVEHSDYVPEPVIPDDSENNIVGINVCSLWAYTSNHGWSCVTPYEEFRPVLGYYDEGSAETADWEIKFLTEHGVDFQAFCWYADQSNAPLKNTRNSIHLHDGFMNAKYSDMMKYCIIWEAANGAHPANSSAFRNYFVPYWIENYFKDDRYMVIDNKPLLLVFGINHFIDDMGGTANTKIELDYLRSKVKELGFDDLIILASNATDSDMLLNAGLDGCYAYNWGTSGYDLDYSISRILACADVGKTYTVPTLSTGFNSLPWHGKRYPNMTVSDYERGLVWIRDTYFEEYPKLDWQQRFVMLSTWNEYGEGTYVMPSEDLNGFGYLDAIRKVFTDDNTSHNDVIPTSSQLERITKNYPQHIRLLRRHDSYTPDAELSVYERDSAVLSGQTNVLLKDVSNANFIPAASGTTKSGLAYVETRDTLGFSLSGAACLRVRMSVSQDSVVKLYYTTSDSPYYAADKCLTFEATAGEAKDYYLYPEGLMSGELERVRIYPSEQSGVSFEVSETGVMASGRLYIDEKFMESEVYPENIDGKMYYAFDPSLAQGYIMNIHFEWLYDDKTLTFYGDNGKYITYTVGSDTAVTDTGTVTLPKQMHMTDGLPMIYMDSLCDALGFEYYYEGRDLYIRTADYENHKYVFTRPDYEWDYSYGADLGWSGNAVSSVREGTLYIRATDNDTRMMMNGVEFNAAEFTDIEVCLAYDNKRVDNLKVFFITNTDGTWDERKQVNKNYTKVSSNGEFETIRLSLTENPYWKDTVTGLRLDPFNATGSECFVKYIKLIQDPSYGDEDSGKPFESVSFNAEDGINPFSSGNADITIVTDPANPDNKVFRVSPTTAGGYIQMNYQMYFEPGATYTVSFDVMAGSIYGDSWTQTSTTIHPDARYDDPSQYNAQNPDDHILKAVSPSSYSNSGQWRHCEDSFTVSTQSFIRSTDTFRIYANPVNGKSLEFYVDNLVITKVSVHSITITGASMTGSGDLTVSGSVGSPLTPEMTAFVCTYDNSGKMTGVHMLDCTETPDFSLTVAGASEVKSVKAFIWSGFRTMKPLAQSNFAAVSD